MEKETRVKDHLQIVCDHHSYALGLQKACVFTCKESTRNCKLYHCAHPLFNLEP